MEKCSRKSAVQKRTPSKSDLLLAFESTAIANILTEDGHNPGSRFAIPKRGTLEATPRVLQDVACRRQDTVRVHSDDLIRTVLYRRRSLRVLAQRKTRHAEYGGFFLDSAGIG